jgi:hypothetical protein
MAAKTESHSVWLTTGGRAPVIDRVAYPEWRGPETTRFAARQIAQRSDRQSDRD